MDMGTFIGAWTVIQNNKNVWRMAPMNAYSEFVLLQIEGL